MDGRFSIITIARGLLGWYSNFISFLLSNNKKNSMENCFYFNFNSINNCSFNFKISIIQSIFEIISKFFIRIINYTASGSSFLFSSLIDQENSLIYSLFKFTSNNFLSALTSVLYHLGIVQRVVSFLAWTLNKFLKITGARVYL